MLGDPCLDDENQSEWGTLVSKCLPSRSLPPYLSCPQAIKCLANVAKCFEEFTLQCTIFQVVGAAGPSKKKRLKLKRHTENHQCICSADLYVRMWTTSTEETAVEAGRGIKETCAFHSKSTVYKQLVAIPNRNNHLLTQGTSEMLTLSDEPSMGAHSASMTDGNWQGEHLGLPASLTVAASLEGTSEILTEPSQALEESDENPKSSLQDGQPTGMILEEVAEPQSDSPLSGGRDAAQRCQGNAKEAVSPISDEDVVTNADTQTTISDSPSIASMMELDSQKGVPNTSTPNSSRPKQRPRIFSTRIPKRDSKFFGREDILTSITEFLMPQPGTSGEEIDTFNPGNLVFLHGSPGLGKTSIALESTYRIQQAFDHIFWLRADSELHLAQSFYDAATTLKLVQSFADHNHANSRRSFLAWLSTTGGKCLIVFDDADDAQVLLPLAPYLNRASVIITSRQPLEKLDLQAARHKSPRSIRVEGFNDSEAIAFLQSLMDNRRSAELCDLKAIAKRCGHIPLLLRRIGTITKYSSLLRDQDVIDRVERIVNLCDFYGLSLGLSEMSKNLMDVMALFDCNRVDDGILLGAQRCSGSPPMPVPTTDEDYFDSRDELLRNAVVSQVEPRALAMHRVIQHWVRAKLSPTDFAQAFRWACLLLEAQWPSKRKIRNAVLGNWPEFDSLHSHVHELAKAYMERGNSKGSDILLNENLPPALAESYLSILLQSTSYVQSDHQNRTLANCEEIQCITWKRHRRSESFTSSTQSIDQGESAEPFNDTYTECKASKETCRGYIRRSTPCRHGWPDRSLCGTEQLLGSTATYVHEVEH